jgi:N-acetylglutamate synthase-like GNAT family acetyltransferase
MREEKPDSLLIRRATEKDCLALAQLRWDFSPDEVQTGLYCFETFSEEFEKFFTDALQSDQWQFWVAEAQSQIVGNAFLELVRKVPRPGRKKYWGYITNVYVQPEWRNRRIGHALIEAITKSAKEINLEFLVLWPSKESLNFYRDLRFQIAQEAMQLYLQH